MSVHEENIELIDALMKAVDVRFSTLVVNGPGDRLELTMSDGSTLTIDGGTKNRLDMGQLKSIAELLIPTKITSPIVGHRQAKRGLSAAEVTVVTPRIARPPGVYLLMFAEFVYSRKKYERVLLPTVTDMREEYYEALAAGRIEKSRWVRIRGLGSFWLAIAADVPISAIGLVKKIWMAAN